MIPLLPKSELLRTEILAQVFSHTTNSYKLYWFYAILNHLKKGGSETVSFQDLISDMVVLSWHTVAEYKVSLGKLDKLDRLVLKSLELKGASQQLNDIKAIEGHFQAVLLEHKQSKKWLKELYRNVPYFFLSPFFQEETRKMDSNAKAKKIELLAQNTFDSSQAAPYKFDGHQIIIHPLWKAYFIKNIVVLEAFIFWNLVQYLQARNPNVPNIARKIKAPDPKRKSLSNARKLWSDLLKTQTIHCIYGEASLSGNKYALDHFVPWSFVAHDMLWNLVPASQSANSSKSNNLPKLDVYFKDFGQLQYVAFHQFIQQKKKNVEDYSFLFRDTSEQIQLKSESDFIYELKGRMSPLIEIARNSGFSADWVYGGN